MSAYSEYFDIDEGYYPEINPQSIQDPSNRWEKTFPHSSFIELLEATERMLARESNSDKKGIWIEGAYGTGKSRVAWTLKSLLECPDAELCDYFDEYSALKSKPDLRDRLLAHKQGKIVTAYRYGSGSIDTINKLIMAVYEGVTRSLEEAGVTYKGTNTLRGKIAGWISEDDVHAEMFRLWMSRPKYSGLGSLAGRTVEDIVAQLSNNDVDATSLIEDILSVAEQEGVRAFDINMDDLTNWLTDVIDENGLHGIVFIWDEFSSYFKNNRTTLDEFQKLAELPNAKPFYLMIITHMSGSLVGEGDQAFKIVRDRFIRREIEMPDSVAFDLIGHALKVKTVARDEWEIYAGDLNSAMPDSRKAVSDVVGANNATLAKLLPIHPMAALLLKYISTAFASNQRSMFSFIKNPDTDNLEAFQWYIANHSPEEGDILTIDFLWNFFYEKGTDDNTSLVGRSNLDFTVSAILDAYPSNESRLNTEEKRVLKTILMMQAISKKLNNGVEILRPNERNLNLAFEGTDLENNRACNIARNVLVNQLGILYMNPTKQGEEFAAVALAGDGVEIDSIKKRRLKEIRTARLVDEGQLMQIFSLGPALRARYDLSPVTCDNFTATINRIRNEMQTHQIRGVVCFARDDVERRKVRTLITNVRDDESFANIVIVDATSNTFGTERLEKWASYAANEEYWRSKDNNQANNHKKNAVDLLGDWRSDLASGMYFVYSCYAKEQCNSIQRLEEALAAIVSKRYPYSFDFAKVSEGFFAAQALPTGAKCGIQESYQGVYQQKFINQLLAGAINVPNYWETPAANALLISKLKIEIDQTIQQRLNRDARISIRDIFDYLCERGFMPCNLYAYLTGFLLKEYATDAYRYGVGESGENGGIMTQEKLADIISEYMKHKSRPIRNYREKFIEIMTQEQKAFVDFTVEAFGVPENASVEVAASFMRQSLKGFGYPIWCLSVIDANNLSVLIDKMAAIASTKSGENVPTLAAEFGRMLGNVPTAKENLIRLLSKDNGPNAMRAYLEEFENGALLEYEKKLGVDDILLDVKRQIGAGEALWLWDQETGEEELRKLLADYQIVDASTPIIGKTNSFAHCMSKWGECIRFAIKIPMAALVSERPDMAKILKCLYDIETTGDLPHEKRPMFLGELEKKGSLFKEFVDNIRVTFSDIYSVYLNGFSEGDIEKLYAKLPAKSFTDDRSTFERKISSLANEARADQKKFQLHHLWESIVHYENAQEWSKAKRTPMLALVPTVELQYAKRLFTAVESSNPTNKEVEFALEFLERMPSFLKDLDSSDSIDAAFIREIVGEYRSILDNPDEVRTYLEKNVQEDAYYWFDSKRVQEKVQKLASSKYLLGVNKKVLSIIDDMDPTRAKKYLKDLVVGDMKVGMAIIEERGLSS